MKDEGKSGHGDWETRRRGDDGHGDTEKGRHGDAVDTKKVHAVN